MTSHSRWQNKQPHRRSGNFTYQVSESIQLCHV